MDIGLTVSLVTWADARGHLPENENNMVTFRAQELAGFAEGSFLTLAEFNNKIANLATDFSCYHGTLGFKQKNYLFLDIVKCLVIPLTL